MANIIKLNKAQKGIELHFSEKPSEDMVKALKKEGFRYSFRQVMWYAKHTEDLLARAKLLMGECSVEEIEGVVYEKPKKATKAPKGAKKGKKAKTTSKDDVERIIAEIRALLNK